MPQKPWTEKDEKMLREMWVTHTSGQIAEIMGRSRSGVCGKASRLGLQKKDLPQPVKYRGLDPEEELALIVAWQDHGDVDARNKLIMAHNGMMHKLALKYWKGDRADEFYSAAVLGAIRAANKFDRTKGNRFSTYLFHWARGFMSVHGKGLNKKSAEATTLDATIPGDGATVTHKDMIKDETLADPEDVVYIDEVRKEIAKAMMSLTQKEREVIMRRFFTGEILQEIADDYGVTRERVRQIEAKALGKLQPKLRRHAIPTL